jgi:hypothetical protein
MSFVPKYQWLTEKKDNACGNACDVVQIDATAEKKFQVAFTPTSLINQNFDGNNIALPMEKIWVGLGSFGSGSGTGEYYGIRFDIDLTPENHFINSFSFFYEGQAYCFAFTVDVNALGIEIIEYGGITLVKMSEVFTYDKYTSAFTQVMSPFGISIIEDGSPSFTVYGFPENTQVETGNITPYNTVITEGVGERTFGLSNFLPFNNMACYFNITSLERTGTCTPSVYTLPILLVSGKRLIITAKYTNNLSFDNIQIRMRVLNSIFGIIDTIYADVYKGSNTIVFNYETVSTEDYIFDFTLTDLSCGFQDEIFGFCFDLIKVETIEKLDTITAVGCTTQDSTFYRRI